MVSLVKTFASLENSHAAQWRERLAYWETALAQKPDSPVAWRWRIQVKVLRFMLSRYGTAPVESAPPSNDGITVFNPAPQPQPAREAWQLSRKLWKVYNANLAKPEELRHPAAYSQPRKLAAEARPFLFSNAPAWQGLRRFLRWWLTLSRSTQKALLWLGSLSVLTAYLLMLFFLFR